MKKHHKTENKTNDVLKPSWLNKELVELTVRKGSESVMEPQDPFYIYICIYYHPNSMIECLIFFHVLIT